MSGDVDVPLPDDLVKDVFNKVTSYDSNTINSWLDQFIAERSRIEKENENENEESDEDDDGGSNFTFESVRKKIGKKKLEKLIKEKNRKHCYPR
jgi:hypothetical protein